VDLWAALVVLDLLVVSAQALWVVLVTLVVAALDLLEVLAQVLWVVEAPMAQQLELQVLQSTALHYQILILVQSATDILRKMTVIYMFG
jgi:hypothetical protein